MVSKLYICSQAFPYPEWECDYEYFFATLCVYLTTLFSKIFCFSDFFRDWTGQKHRHTQTQTQTDMWTDRIFSIYGVFPHFQCIHIMCLRRHMKMINFSDSSQCNFGFHKVPLDAMSDCVKIRFCRTRC